jgi:hypothetical protein
MARITACFVFARNHFHTGVIAGNTNMQISREDERPHQCPPWHNLSLWLPFQHDLNGYRILPLPSPSLPTLWRIIKMISL